MLELILSAMHGATDPSADTNFVQRFIDSGFGIVFAAAAHTLGALLFTAGLAVYLYQARVVAHAKAAGAEPTLRWLPLAHALNIIGIGLNGTGGMMRLKESDHPGLELLGSSLWVQVILIKHLFLIVGVGLALYLTARTYQLARQEGAPRNFLPEVNRITAFSVVSFSTILLASVLGGVASNAPIPSEEAAKASETPGGPNGMAMGPHTYYENSSATMTTPPAMAGRATTGINVEPGATGLHVTVKWQNDNALDADLTDCHGNAVTATKNPNPKQVDLIVSDPCAGGWSVVVRTAQPQGTPTGEPYTIVAEISVGASGSGDAMGH